MRHTILKWALCLIILAFAVPSVTAHAAGLSAENLLTDLPQGFKIGLQTQQGPMIMMEYVPVSETVHDWTKMVTVQVFRNLDNADGKRFASGIAMLWTSSCPGSQAKQIGDDRTNGYPHTLWRFTCPLNSATGKPENMWLKTISGKDALYVVQYAYRLPLAAGHEMTAIGYLEKASVCDTRTPKHPCPAGM